MKKKKIKTVLLVIITIITLVLTGVYSTKQNKKKQEEKIAYVEDIENATEYIYSDEQLEVFKKKVDEQREFEINDIDLKYGEDYFYFKNGGYQENKIYIHNGLDNYAYIIDDNIALNNNLDAEDIKISDLFNSDLSLKHPEIFSGYVYQLHQYDSLDEAKSKIESVGDSTTFEGYVAKLKYLDKEPRTGIEMESFEGNLNINLNCYLAKFNSKLNSDKKYSTNGIYGYSLIRLQEFNNDNVKKDTVMSRLHQIYSYDPDCAMNMVSNFGIPQLEESKVNTLFPEELNLIKKLDKESFINYYPVKVEKKDNIFYVYVKTDFPIYDELQMKYIKYRMAHNFLNRSKLFVTPKDYDVIVKFVYEELTNGMYEESPSFSILAEGAIEVENSDGRQFVYSIPLYNRFNANAPWYPNKEAQKWIKSYFEKIKPLYDEDIDFSIFDNIKAVADEYNANYQSVEDAILSYYYLKIILN